MNNVDDMINILVKERNQTLAEKEKQIKFYKNSYNDSQRELTIIKNELNNKNYQLNNKQNEINNIQNQLNNTQIQLNSIQGQLTDTQNKLKNAQYQIQNLQNQLTIAQNELQIEKNFNNDLKLKESNQTINNKKIDSLNSEIIDMRAKYDFNNKKIVNLMDEIKQKENELKKLNFIITKFSKELNPINIKFKTSNSSKEYKIICYYSEIFLNVEEKLYQSFPELRKKNNLFLFNGNTIEKEKSIILNEINNSSVILIINQN
jgi:chromosome segregation ATPase